MSTRAQMPLGLSSTQAAAPKTTHAALPRWSSQERGALLALRTRYAQGRDLFTDSELARLQFVRWLYRTGQLVP